MSDKEKRTDLERVQELFDFLQGKCPEDTVINDAKKRMPKLTSDQAWVAVWFIQELHWQVIDTIDRCDVCGDLYDSNREGGYKESGPPHHFCEPCYDDIAEEDRDA